MALKIKQRTKELYALIFYVILYIFIQIISLMYERSLLAAFNGVLMSLQYGLCLLMINNNRKKGIVVSMALMGFTSVMILRALIFSRSIGPLPGFCNSIFYLITIFVLAMHQRKSEIASITDLLTGVSNRRGLYKNLKERISNQESFSVIYISLDNFKVINDNYGHAYGDELLRKIAKKMRAQLGKDDTITRIGGAEFVVAIRAKDEAEKIANELLESIRQKSTISIDNKFIDVYMTCYAGLASYPADASDYESVIKYADIAMYEALSAQSETAFVFDQRMAKDMNRQVEVEQLIKEGLEKDYFYLVYQPQFDINDKKLRGFETLIRMKTPDGTMISPGEFIPVAEKSDFILQIDDYVLKRAMNEFKDIVTVNDNLTISINVSAKNFGKIDFVDKVKDILQETGYPAKNLEIEITEYCMVDSMKITIRNIELLREMGIQIALDDFGTGYTSLNYLAKLPINLLKIDKSLVDDIVNDEKSREFVSIVISMGHLMGCEVISEGVEDEKQLACLREDDCDFVQGYVWSKPLEYEKAKEII